MKRLILSIISLLLILSFTACNDAKNTYEDIKSDQVDKGSGYLEYAKDTYNDTKSKVIKLKQDTIQQVSNLGNGVSNYSNEMVNNVTQSVQLWIYETLKPIFPWTFLILFLLIFGVLKMIIPFSSYMVVQIPIFLGSYGFVFSMFYKLKIASYALEATLWFLIILIIVGVSFYFSRKTLIPKIKKFNQKFNVAEDAIVEVKTN